MASDQMGRGAAGGMNVERRAKLDVRVRKLMVLVAVIALVGCERRPAERDVPLPRKPDLEAERARKYKYEREYENVRVALTRKGQGCAGHVLRGRELADAVRNKVDLGRAIPSLPLVYFGDGRLHLSNGTQQWIRTGRYTIAGDQLCRNIPSADIRWCSRLIRTSRSQVAEEGAILQNSVPPRLTCVPIKLTDMVSE